MKLRYITFIFASTLILFTQENNYVREVNPFEVSFNTGVFENVFSGGLNNPEFQFVDIDSDDDLDLFVMSSDGTLTFFENTGNKFSAHFELSLQNPTGLVINDWFFFVDIDNDNDFDCFTGQKGSKVNYFENNGSTVLPSFISKIDTVRNTIGNDLNVETGSNPAFADIDFDGDYDLVAGNTSGTANFYENIGSSEQFLFDTLDANWQNLQVGTGKIVNSFRHGASSIEFFDIDQNGTLDLFWGDLFNTSLYFIENSGTPISPSLSIVSTYFPMNQDSITTKGFNMPRFVDIDSDNEIDLFTSVLWPDISIKESINYREGIGGENFQFVNNNYLRLLDVGSRSSPDLVDIDGDNDLDLFIGSESTLTNGTIFFLENIGSPEFPRYLLVDSSFANINVNQIASPSFGDLDNDGDYDLVISEFFNNIFFLENIGDKFSPNFIFSDTLRNSNSEVIKAKTYSKPKLTDIDLDGDLDLIYGNFNGEIICYKNNGSSASYSFELDESYFNIEKPGNYTNPTIYDYDKDGINELFVGTSEKNILLFENDNNLSPNFFISDDNFLNNDFGSEPDIIFADIDNDTDADIFVGNIKGGLYFFRNETISSVNAPELAVKYEISLKSYPNPFNGTVQIIVKVPNNLYFSLKIFNILGEEVALLYDGISDGEARKFEWNTNRSNFRVSSGTYIISVQSDETSQHLPILFLK